MTEQPDPEIVITDPTHLLTVTYADGSTNQVSWCEKPNLEKMTSAGKTFVPDPTGDTFEDAPNHLVVYTGAGGCTVIPKQGLRQWKVRSVAEHKAEIAFRNEKAAEVNARLAEKEAAERQAALEERAARARLVRG